MEVRSGELRRINSGGLTLNYRQFNTSNRQAKALTLEVAVLEGGVYTTKRGSPVDRKRPNTWMLTKW